MDAFHDLFQRGQFRAMSLPSNIESETELALRDTLEIGLALSDTLVNADGCYHNSPHSTYRCPEPHGQLVEFEPEYMDTSSDWSLRSQKYYGNLTTKQSWGGSPMDTSWHQLTRSQNQSRSQSWSLTSNQSWAGSPMDTSRDCSPNQHVLATSKQSWGGSPMDTGGWLFQSSSSLRNDIFKDSLVQLPDANSKFQPFATVELPEDELERKSCFFWSEAMSPPGSPVSSEFEFPMRISDHPLTSPVLEPETLDSDDASVIASIITAVTSDKASYRKLLHADRWKAQRLVDITQAVLESPGIDDLSRRELVVTMQRFSKSAGVYPQSYRLTGVSKLPLACTGEGAFGTVHRGVYQARNVCLKALKLFNGRTTQAQLFKAVAHEAILWKQLNHRNILPFYGICELDIGLCMVSPWMRLGDLREYIRGPVSPEERLLLARDVAEGLKYLHSYEIIHGDLKGKNVLIDGVGRARIADFGLTSINDPVIAYWTSQSMIVSKGGTVAFKAPEILLASDDADDKNSKAGDMYAWGCVCYELYVGEDPYKGSKNIIICKKLHNELPLRPEDNSPAWKRHGLTEKMWSLMQKTWNVVPDLRPDASEAIDRVSDMIDDDSRHLEDDEQEPVARFLSHWCRAPIGDDTAPSGMNQEFKIPTVQEVEELLKLP